ncbi:ribonuclease MC-like [Cucumis melo var. makuwa]|uniref:Ribonuclease MC-like n=1 Tax=Cucumis melo var. makuwa TaxID=1194695 RepID=A0A5A7UJ53_CUCMM|nr:ribonuclease MC-like [Cucumis melo var. makuwa]TYK25637.1 ribonuclease MC-like [Cucumis melo var. makuwa]
MLLFVVTLSISLFPTMKSQIFDDFYFVQQWPPAVCAGRSGQCVGQGFRYFTIHGVWPQKGGQSIVNCPGTKFDVNQISSLTNTLHQTWPDVINGKDQTFWEHEWNKHGTCSESKYQMLPYFQMAINMKYKIDVLGAMRVGGVVPNNHKKAKQRVEVVIFNAYHAYPLLRCKKDSTGQYLLTEVVMCFKDDGVTLLNCTRSKSTCGADFLF